jgi:hypothetical protein
MSLRKSIFLLCLVLLLSLTVGAVGAQDTPTSNVTYFMVICENSAIVNLSGTMQAGYDIYFQVFSESQGGGNAITPLRQVAVDGAYEFSETVGYTEGVTIPIGHVSSFYIAIAREGDSTSTIYSDIVDDLQDGCTAPQFAPASSTSLGDATPGGAEGGSTDPVITDEGTVVDCTPTDPATLPYILSPFGDYLNPGYVPPLGAPCQPWELPRQETAGLIFVECNQFTMAEPGIIYDNDEITFFWSWYAYTQAQVQDHMDNVEYSVTFYGNNLVPVPYVLESEIEYIGYDWWVFYTAPMGNLRPGHYGIAFYTQWDAPITDGYDDYGPGTDYPLLNGSCDFDVLPNLAGEEVVYTNWPPYYP